jgi:hypothetical protein
MHGLARRAGYPSDSMRAAGSAASRHRRRGELLPDWTKDYNYAAAPPCHLRHRLVTVAQLHDSDGDGLPSRPGYGLPAAGRSWASSASFAAPRARFAGRRVISGSSALTAVGSDTACRPPAGCGLVLSRAALRIRPSSRRDALGPAAHASADPDTARQPPDLDCARAPPARMLLLLTRLDGSGPEHHRLGGVNCPLS